MGRFLLCLLIGLTWVWQCQSATIPSVNAGMVVTEAPSQQLIEAAEPFSFNGYQLTPLATFAIQARVLSREDYLLDRQSDLSPTDLALGWQSMSDLSILQSIRISQSGRWYYWQVDEFPVPRRTIETQSANMHLIPANQAVEVALYDVREGDVIALSGQLIEAVGRDGWRWKSSLTREDVGNHACELIWVTDLKVLSRP